MESQGRNKKNMKVSLPQELVQEILLRLPVKSLMQFKCVCRSWYALFTTPAFITMHTRMHNNNKDKALMIFSCDMLNAEQGSLECLIKQVIVNNDQSSCTVQDVECPLSQATSPLLLSHPWGSHKGVFGLDAISEDDNHRLILWNPATRELKDVPAPHTSSSSECIQQFLLRGLGCDPKTNEFKIVHLYINSKNERIRPYVELYNLRTDSWTLLSKDTLCLKEKFIPLNSLYHGVTLANGVCHWLLHNKYILCFDFCSDRFHRLELPPINNTKSEDFLTEVNDSIAYVVYEYDSCPPSTKIWLLEQNNCWTKKYKFRLPYSPSIVLDWFIWKNGAEFLGPSKLSDDDYEEYVDCDKPVPLVSYNSDGKPVGHLKVHVNSNLDYYIYNYVESLAPLNLSS